jgi:hypothetical protein
MDYVKTQYEDGLGATKQMVFSAIAYLRYLKEQEGGPPPS